MNDLNDLAWFLIAIVTTLMFLYFGKEKPSFWTGVVSSVAFFLGVASQHIQLF